MIPLPNIPPWEQISLDYETNSLEYWGPDFRVFGIAVATRDGQWYFDVREQPEAVSWLRDLMYSRQDPIIAQFAQFEIQCSRVLKIDPRICKWYCTMTAECLIDEHALQYDLYNICLYHNIDSQKKRHLDALQAVMGVRSHAEVLSGLSAAPVDLTRAYGSSDARDAFDVYCAQKPLIYEQGLQEVVKLEMDLCPVLADMSWGGIRVDIQAAHAAIPALDEQADVLQSEINAIVGNPFNVNSTPQVRAFFKPEPVNRFQWRLIDGTLVGPTKGNKGPSIDAKAMLEIKHPLAEKILGLRKTIKLRDTFIRGHILGSADLDGYVHTTFNQTRNDADAGTVTGRLSSTGPALQQITKRDKKNAAILRAMFLPDEGEFWMGADYNQIDFRMAAHLINDPSVIEAYRLDPKTDYHQIVSDMTGIPRNPAYAGAPNTKTLNLSLAFGAGPGKIAFSMGMPYSVKEFKGKMTYVPGPEAEAIFEKYHKAIPGVKRFAKHAENVARTSGYVRTILGRRLRFPRGTGAHKAAGLLFQANAADVNKLGLVAVDKLIREKSLPARLMTSVHDEIGVSMPNDAMTANMISDAFTSPGRYLGIRVPVTASISISRTWWNEE